MTAARDWLQRLAWLSPDDLRRISRMVDLLVVSDPAAKAEADRMLDAAPEPRDDDEGRQRLEAINGYLEQRRHA